MPLASKIRYSYVIVILPILIFMGICVVTLVSQNRRYNEIIDAAGKASEFSLDFKKDFDYETYLVIVESKSYEESELENMLNEATRVVDSLVEKVDISSENADRLEDIRKYLNNLDTYVGRIKENLEFENRYDDNMLIWENDVQIVTALLQETIIATAKSKYKVKSLHTYADKINRILSCLATEKDFSVSYMEVVFYDGIKWHIFI